MKIDKGIPVPDSDMRVKYPFDLMDIGDSFIMQVPDGKKISSVQTSIISSFKRWNKKKGYDFVIITRRESSGDGKLCIRAWLKDKLKKGES